MRTVILAALLFGGSLIGVVVETILGTAIAPEIPVWKRVITRFYFMGFGAAIILVGNQLQ